MVYETTEVRLPWREQPTHILLLLNFFINHKDNDFLNFRTNQVEEGWGYAVFGKVTEGMDVVDKIADVQTTAVSYYQDVPAEAIKILKAEVID